MRGMLVYVAMMWACGGGQAKPFEPVNFRGVSEDAVLAAVGNADAFEKLMSTSVMNGGLWFADPGCAQLFAGSREIPPEQFHGFAACLATLTLKSAPRSSPYADVGVLQYPPGLEIEVRVADMPGGGKRLSWIGFESRRNDSDSLPTLTSALLESLRTAGDPAVASATHKGAYAWVKMCLGEDGNITGVTPYETSSAAAEREMMAAMSTWAFKAPPVGPACAMVRLGGTETMHGLPISPMTDDGLILIPNTDVHRIAGPKLLVPDEDGKREIARSGATRVTGIFEVCLDAEGKVTHVVPIRSSGFPRYDRGVATIIKTQWRYTPYVEDGKALRACTKVVYIYSQS